MEYVPDNSLRPGAELPARPDPPKAPAFEAVAGELLPAVYGELHALAAGLLRGEGRVGMGATSLIHEAYVRLSAKGSVACEDRTHFFALAANAMRRILVDHARRRSALRHGGGRQTVQLDEVVICTTRPDSELLAVDAALEDLARFDSGKARIAEMRFFGGMTVDETADALDISRARVKREWSLAKAWLLCALQE